MRVGISITSGYRGVDYRDAMANIVDRSRAAVGLDHLSLGDHHAAGPDRIYGQNVPLIGRIMAHWPHDRPIGLLMLLPLWHPVLAAEQVGTLASMTEARFILQTGIGFGAGQFAAMGRRLEQRGDDTDEAIRIIKGLLAGETMASDRFALANAAISPHQSVEWWIGSGTGDRPLERAARHGDAWYAGPGLTDPELREAGARYRALCRRFGTEPRICLRRDVFLADDHDRAVRRARDVMAGGYRGLGEDVVIFGGVDHVTEAVMGLADAGVDDVVARIMAVDQPEAIRAIELLSEVRARLP